MIVICGNSIAEVERDLELAKRAMASGMPCGVGGATIGDAEKGLEMMRSMCGVDTAPISNPNYVAPKSCGCNCGCCDYEDEEKEDEWYEDEEEEEENPLVALANALQERGLWNEEIDILISRVADYM